jgi:alkylated DNA repair dioxygenase AlkB
MPYLQSQAAKTNKGSSANLMIGLNLRWDYKSNNPNQEAVNIDKTINNSENQRNKYGYYELSVNGQPLGPIDQRIKDLISKATGIDATNYDGAIINLYDDKTFISAHNDVDESVTAIGYPVLVVNIGGSGNFSVEGAKKSNNYSSKVYEDKLLNAGDAYVFGVDGKNREVYHRTFASSVKGFLPELTIDNDNVKKTFPKGSYRISITLRRVMDLEPGMPKTPNKVNVTQPSTTSEKSFTTKVDQFTYTYNPSTGEVIHNAKSGDKIETNETQINKVLAAYAKANNFETKVFNKQEYVQIDNKVLNVNTGSRVTQKEILDLFTPTTQIDLNQEVYSKVKTNLSQLIVRENAEFNSNPDAVTYPDEINMSEFNGYPKIINFLNEASITDNQLKFFAAHQEYIEALLNETGATDMNELLEAIQEEEVEIEPTESQIEFGMSDSTIADIENEIAETEEMISESKAGNDIMLFPGVPANAGQTKAIEKLNNFVKDKGRQVFVLKGRGGTGKTTIIKKILEKLEGKEIAAATLGHKAKGVLQSSMGSKVKAGTIASAIGIRPDRKNPGQFIKVDSKYFNKTKSPFYNADVIIIDECSMLTQEMVNDIINFSKNPNVKIIFMGDNVQLPPMEADKNLQNKDSASFTANTKPEYTATLTERMRQGEDSPIVSLSDVIAANVESKEPELRPIKNRTNKFDAKKNTGILFETKDSMVTQLTNDLQNDKENTKIITFTHAEKNSMNNLAREILWGKGNTNEFNKGEILINNDNKEQSSATSQDVFNGEQYSVLSFTPLTISVKEISEDYSISNKSLPGYTLKVQNETGQIITIQVLSPKVKEKYSDIQNNNRVRALKMGGTTMEDVWWNNEDKHVNVDYGYAAISHDAQGSTYNNVYVMEDNILGVQNASIKTKNQSLYVAVTRPRYKAVIVSNKNAGNVSVGEEYTTKGLNIDTRGKSFEPKEISEEDINNLPRLNCE